MVDDDRIAHLLSQLEPQPESPEEIRRSHEQIMAGLVERGLVDLAPDRQRGKRLRSAPPWLLRPRPRLALLIAAVVTIAAVAAFAASPTGEAVARWVGDVFGIGEPGGSASLDSGTVPQRRDPASGAHANEIDSSAQEPKAGIVLGASKVAGIRVELVASTTNRWGSCISVDLPRQEEGLTTCPDRDGRSQADSGQLTVDAFSTKLADLPGMTAILGRAPHAAASVEAVDNRNRYRGQLIDPPTKVRRQAGIGSSHAFFIALIPGQPRSVTLIALDNSGVEMTRTPLLLRAEHGSGRPVPADP